jgi:hypothetical protein
MIAAVRRAAPRRKLDREIRWGDDPAPAKEMLYETAARV